jgi:hypothetical protein
MSALLEFGVFVSIGFAAIAAIAFIVERTDQ